MESDNPVNKKERVIIFLDGSNFYHRLKDPELDFKQLLDFNYKEFARWLAYEREIISCIFIMLV